MQNTPAKWSFPWVSHNNPDISYKRYKRHWPAFLSKWNTIFPNRTIYASECKDNFQWQFAQFCRNQIFVTNYTLLGRAWIIWWNKKDKYQVWLIIAQQSDWNNWPLTASIWSRQRWHLAGKDVNRQALPQFNPTRMNENQISLSSEIKDSGCSVFNNPILPLKQLGCFPILWLYVPGQSHYCIAVQCCITEHVLYYCTYTLYDAVHGI